MSEEGAFAGLLLLNSALLHPPRVIEPGWPLRVALGRALCRSWLWAGVWLASWSDLWLLMALEGRAVHEFVRQEFGEDEAAHRLSVERRRCAESPVAISLVPDAAELDRWGGGLHPEQIWSEARARKASLVLRMLEAAVKRTEGGAIAFTRILARVVDVAPTPPSVLAASPPHRPSQPPPGTAPRASNRTPPPATSATPAGTADRTPPRATPPPPTPSQPAGPLTGGRIGSTRQLIEACTAAGARM